MLFALLALSSMVNAVYAQSIPKPAVPEFTVELVAHPYDVAPITTIDPYTGKNVITGGGYHVENRSIEVKIKNQPFTPYTDVNGNSISLYYNISSKGHYENDWTYYPNLGINYPASNSEYTIISYGFGGSPMSPQYTSSMQPHLIGEVPDGSEIDFRVEALIGYHTEISWNVTLYPEFVYYEFTGESSGWSNTKTITINWSQTSSPEPTSPTLLPSEEPQLEQEVILGVAVTVAVVCIGVGLLVYLIKRK